MNDADIILEKYINNEYKAVFTSYTPDAVTKLLDAFGNPQNSFRSIHIAGTNGKGSTAFYVAEIFKKAGYSTGLFMSPHLDSICERIRLNSELISEQEFARLSRIVQEKADSLENLAPTFFDMVTVISFLCFKEHNVDIAVVETGLGGRCDSTNILLPLCSIITSVSLDHTAILGDTVELIAKEKAGIIKQGVPLVTSNSEYPTFEILKNTCLEKSAPFYCFGNEFKAVNIRKVSSGYIYDLLIEIETTFEIKDIHVNSPVYEQIENTACAIIAVLLLRNDYANISIENASSYLADYAPPGRFQVLSNTPFILYDPAHNPSAISSFMRTIGSEFYGKNIIAVVSFMADKDHASMISIISKFVSKIIYYELEIPRAYKPDSTLFSNEICNSIDELMSALSSVVIEDSIFIFTGSFRLFPVAKEITEKFRL